MGAFPTGRFHFAGQLDQCSLERPEESMQHHTHLLRTEEEGTMNSPGWRKV